MRLVLPTYLAQHATHKMLFLGVLSGPCSRDSRSSLYANEACTYTNDLPPLSYYELRPVSERLPTTYYLLLYYITCYLLPTTYYLLSNTYCLLPTAYYL